MHLVIIDASVIVNRVQYVFATVGEAQAFALCLKSSQSVDACLQIHHPVAVIEPKA
ncbi:hypothetical protein [Bordetella genomosp. 1]|uniref:hypothetical protein n=1 Tax=Bordetella genomosp. 1 TaxID=1395607 RepID=UPI001595BC56|nr:hypothetical protein [Bordetella genomosp. 1]MDQ8030805.1 hypothetical protein [Bordetella sp.]